MRPCMLSKFAIDTLYDNCKDISFGPAAPFEMDTPCDNRTIVIGAWAIAVFCVASRNRNVLVWFIVLLCLCIYMFVIFQLFYN